MRTHIAHSASLLLAQETGEEPVPTESALPWLDVYSALGGPGGV